MNMAYIIRLTTMSFRYRVLIAELGLAMIAIMRCILLGMRICTGAILRKSGPIGWSEGIACLG